MNSQVKVGANVDKAAATILNTAAWNSLASGQTLLRQHRKSYSLTFHLQNEAEYLLDSSNTLLDTEVVSCDRSTNDYGESCDFIVGGLEKVIDKDVGLIELSFTVICLILIIFCGGKTKQNYSHSWVLVLLSVLLPLG